ncbi:protein deglycase HchA [Paracoccus sp. 11-3]|uniref:Protein deglycase HchA n=1 Tax=Paracoccus amoyensis TaxID=2760093 RepID=A0A926GPJ5_9RHOB|nr:glyoxalase III HchA [Paracoccus amoyensis]MBC9247625.1 protein deglycase HchA [Paracoccus amoyensis]
MTQDLSREPTTDPAEENAFFPSPYSLGQYTSSKTDFAGLDFDKPYTGGKWKILVIASDERYVLMTNGKFFSSGNHPVEMLLPMHHIDAAGFEIEVATRSGNPVKFENWALPKEDQAVMGTYEKYLDQIKQPNKLSDVLPELLAEDSPYLGVFIPGGHGALVGIPESDGVKTALNWALDNDRFIITLCHGPACLLAAAKDVDPADYPFKGYEVCVFPDALDKGANIDIGYMPGALPWLVGERLRALGVNVLNKDMTGAVHRDRKLLTGDSPLASNNLGKLAAKTLLEAVA